jgi:Tol biopolymer transport system component
MNRQGRQTGDLGPIDEAEASLARLSPDGKYVAFYRQAGSALGSVWVMNVAEGTPRQLRDGTSRVIWSPDGENMAFAALRSIPNGLMGNLYEQPVSILRGSGRWLKAAATSEFETPDDWSRNDFVLYEITGGRGAGDLLAMPVRGGDSIPVAETPARERNGRFSPDGNWAAYESDETGGRFEIYVQPFPGTPSLRQRVSVDGGTNPQWGRGGRELYFLAPDYKLMVANVTLSANGREIEVGRPQPLFSTPLRAGAEFEASPDGERFLINAPIEEAPPIYVLRNFAAAKK